MIRCFLFHSAIYFSIVVFGIKVRFSKTYLETDAIIDRPSIHDNYLKNTGK